MAGSLARGASKGQGDSLGHLVAYKGWCIYSTLWLPKGFEVAYGLTIKDATIELTQKEIKTMYTD